MSFPTVKPARPVYPPPVPTGPLPDPGGATPVEHAYRTQKAVADAYTRWRQAHSPDIAPDVAKANAGAFAVSDAALQLPDVLETVSRMPKTPTPRRTNCSGAAASPTTTWIRLKRNAFGHVHSGRWTRSKNPAKLVAAAQDVVANADAENVPTICEELSAYLASKGVPAGWIPAALAEKVPGLADAQTAAILANRQRDVLAQNDA